MKGESDIYNKSLTWYDLHIIVLYTRVKTRIDINRIIMFCNDILLLQCNQKSDLYFRAKPKRSIPYSWYLFVS